MRRNIRRLWEVIRPHQGHIWLGLLLLLVNAACRLTLPYIVLVAIDEHLVPNKLDGFWTLAGLYLLVAGVETLCRRWQLIALETAGQSSLFDLRLKLFRHLQQLPARFFDRTPLGRLVGRVTTDVEALQEVFSSGLVTILGDFVFLVAALVILFSLSAQLTFSTVLIIPVLVVTTLFVRQKVRQAYTAMRERLSRMNSFLHEHVSGMPIVQMFAQEENRVAAFAEINDGLRDSQLRSVWWESTLSAATEMLSAFTTALILYYGGILQMDDAIKLGTLVAFVDYMGRFFIPLNDLSLKYTVMQNAMVASDRIFDLLDETAEEPDPSSPAQPAGDGHIEFRDVTFGYSDDLPVLSNLSFEARPGERIALVGATGAGKTTILNLLTRLYELQSGQILLDGVDIRQFARNDLRRRIGVVPQDVFMFQGTVLDNIRLGHPGIADADAIRAADELHLDDVVGRFPLGYHEPIAERGKNLSAGEKQLIAFARMLVVAPCVLALDEATSNVDSHTEHLLQGAVHRVMAGRTSLIIAHRLSTIHDVDRILVLHAGKLVEQGSHEELMKRRGVYWRLYQLQYQEQES